MTALTPVYTVGWQIAEQIRAHERTSSAGARARTIDLLEEVGIPTPERRVDEYPHQFSGGMRQRVMIAMALSCNPSLLIADEPTTALDVTIQAQILDLMKRLQRDHGSAIILITHDMGVVADLAERVIVMYAGRVVEEAPKARLFRDPQHPYTWGLLGSMPRIDRPRQRRLLAIPGAPPSPLEHAEGCRFEPRCPHRFDLCSTRPELLERIGTGHRDACHLDPAVRSALRTALLGPGDTPGERVTEVATPSPLIAADDLVKYFPVRTGSRRRGDHELVHAVDGVSLAVQRGETLGVVGESGCGKSTLGRLLVRLHTPTSGTVTFDGTDITRLSRNELRPFRREMQMVFQDPYASLNPRKRVGQIIGDPLRIHRKAGDGDPAARPGSARGRRPLARPHQPLPARVLRRAEAADRRRARAGAEPSVDRGGRAGLGARRLDPGTGREPPRRPPGRARAHLRVHRARSRGRPARLRPDRGDVPRGDRREGAGRSALRAPDPPLHRGAPLRDPGDRDGGGSRPGSDADRVGGGGAEPHSPARRMPLPSSLSLRHRHLRDGAPTARRLRQRGGPPPVITR